METWLRNGVQIRLKSHLAPITRAKAKRFKEAFNVLIRDVHVEEAHMFNL